MSYIDEDGRRVYGTNPRAKGPLCSERCCFGTRLCEVEDAMLDEEDLDD